MSAYWHLHAAAGRAVVELAGELDLLNGEALQRAIGAEVSRERPSALVLDLRRLTFVDSSGVDALIGLGHQSMKDGVSFELLVEPGTIVHCVLRSTGLESQLGSPVGEALEPGERALDDGPGAER